MEEIILVQNNIEKVNFLNLFNDNFHDENCLKIATYIIIENKLFINYDNQICYTFDYLKTTNNIKYFQQVHVLNKSNDYLKIVHENWEDDVILNKELNYLNRLKNEDGGNYEMNNHSINVYWDNYEKETFVLDEHTQKYIIQSKNNYNSIYIKNSTWEEECNYDLNTNILKRNTNDENGEIIFEDNYLTIHWEKWDSELFYFHKNIYQINSFFIKNIKIYLEENQEYFIDQKYIYNNLYYQELLNSKLFEYEKEDIFLNLYNKNQEKIYKLIEIENIFYDIKKLKKLFLENIQYFIFFDQCIILDLHYIVIGEFENKDENTINIHFYNDLRDNSYIIIYKEDNYYLENNDNVYQIYDYHKIIYLEDEIKYLVSNNKKQLVFEYEDKFEIYNKIYKYYFNQKDYSYLKNCNFDDNVYNFFNENYNNIILNIENNKIIYNQYSFEEKYLFLNNFKYLKDEFEINIFEKYGFMFIEDVNLSCINYNKYHIFNIQMNDKFKKTMVTFLEEINDINQNDLKIFIYEDYSDYEYFNSLLEIDLIKNRVLLIDYSKSKIMKMNYYYILLDRLCYLKNITIKKEKDIVDKINEMVIFLDNIKLFMNNKYDFVLFCILYYIKNNLNNNLKLIL